MMKIYRAATPDGEHINVLKFSQAPYLPHISPTSPLYLPYISTISPDISHINVLKFSQVMLKNGLTLREPSTTHPTLALALAHIPSPTPSPYP